MRMKKENESTALNALTKLRYITGLTQEKLAKKMKVKQSSISRAEAYGCSMPFLVKACNACKIKLTISFGEVYEVNFNNKQSGNL